MDNFSQFFDDEPYNEPDHETENNQPEPIYSTHLNKFDNGETPKSDTDEDDDNIEASEEVIEIVDCDMYNLLSSWGFVDLYDHFVRLNISVDILKYITNDDLKELFADKSLGIRVEFKQKLHKWRKENGVETDLDPSIEILNSIKILVEEEVRKRLAETDCSQLHGESLADSPSPSSNASISNPPSPSIGFQNFDIDEILTLFPSGNFVLNDFQKHKKIGDSSRTILIDCITNWLLGYNESITRRDFQYISTKIHNRFNEDPNIYFTQPKRGSKGNPSGRLYCRYYNIKRRNRKIGLNTLPKEPKPFSGSLPVNRFLDEEDTEFLNNDYLADVKWLQIYKEPWEEIKSKWQKTHKIRQLDISKQSFPDILLTWPLLKHSAGVTLINIDFEILYAGKQNILIDKWDSFKARILPIFNMKIKDRNCQDLLFNLNNKNFAKDPEDVLIISLLHAILLPTRHPTTSSEAKKKFIKPTIRDSQQSLLIEVQDLNNLNPTLDQLATKVRALGQSLQPLIIRCCFDESYLVYFNEIKYKFKDILPALDSCFKIFFVLNLKYPMPCKSVWLFIQKYFFEIETSERASPDVLVLIESLKNQ